MPIATAAPTTQPPTTLLKNSKNTTSQTTALGKNNSKKRSRKFVRCNGCARTVDLHSAKPRTAGSKTRRDSFVHMIPRNLMHAHLDSRSCLSMSYSPCVWCICMDFLSDNELVSFLRYPSLDQPIESESLSNAYSVVITTLLQRFCCVLSRDCYYHA